MLRIALFFVVLLMTSCVHTYTVPTGLPADVHDRFMFHMNIEAQEKGLRTAKGDVGLTVYATDGRISYSVGGDEIVAVLTIPNKSGKNDNYYSQKRQALRALSDELINGARKRAQNAQDFAY